MSRFDLAFDGASVDDPSRDQGVYLSIDNGGGGIVGDIVRLTTPPTGRHDIPLSFSPDGSQVLFLRTTDIRAEMGGVGDLFVVDRGSFDHSEASGAVAYTPAEPRRLNPENTWVIASDLFGAGASWAPDGKRVAFAGYAGTADAMSTNSRAYVVDVATGQAAPITPVTINMTSARWSPDGAWIAIDHATPSGQLRQVSLVRPDGSEFHEVVSLLQGSCCAQWSPDSTRLLAQGADGEGDGLFIIEADGSGYSRLVSVDSAYQLRWYGWAQGAAGSTP
jgi:Tol biopolymer transport system component